MKNFLVLLLFLVTTLTFGQREIKDQSLILNNGTDRNSWISVNLGLPGQPKIRYNVATDVWEFSNDGSAWGTFTSLEDMTAALALKAPLASPALTGDPTAPTATAGDNDTSIATTGFVTDAVATSAAADDVRLDALETDVADHEVRINVLETDTTLSDHIADTSAHGTTGNVVGTSDSQTLTNKTISADSNTISDIDVGELKSGVLDADLGGVSASHDTIPSAKAVKDYVDTADASNASALNAHLTDTTDAHDASAVSSVPSGNLVASDVQAALNELQGDSDSLDGRLDTAESSLATLDSTYATDSDLTTHMADTSTHGVASAIVGTTETQTLTNKTLSGGNVVGASIQGPARSDVKQDTEANLTTYAATASNGQIVFATDSKVMYQIVDGALVPVGSGSGEAANLLSNGGFEASAIPYEDWTISPASPTLDITTPFEGEQTLCYVMSGQPLEVMQDFTTNAGAFADGNTEAVASVYYKSNITDQNIYMCPRKAAAITSDCVLLNSDNVWSYAEKFFQLGGTSNGISIHSESYANVASGTICIDKAKVAVRDEQLVGTYEEEDTYIKLAGSGGYAASTVIPVFTVVMESTGSDITYQSTASGNSFTINTDGVYSFNGWASSTASVTNFNIGLSVNSPSLNTAITSQADAYLLTVARDTINTAGTLTKVVPFNWTGSLKAGDVVRVHGDGSAISGLMAHASKQSSLKAIQVNKNQKIKIPTSTLRFEGATGLGSTGVGSVTLKFDNVTKVKGDKLSYVNTAADGTVVTVKENGVLCSAGSVYDSTGTMAYATKNQAAVSIAQSEFISAGGSTSNIRAPLAFCTDVAKNDVFRVSISGAPDASTANFWELTFFSTEVQVSVNTVLPQYSESDLYVKASGTPGGSVTGNTTDIPWTTVSDSTGGAWNGSQFTVPEDGLYSISGSIWATTADSRRISLYIGGTLSKQVNTAVSDTVHKFDLVEQFTKGQVISFRSGTTFTLNTAGTQYNYLNIAKVGKPNVDSVDVTPFVDIPRMERQSFKGDFTGNLSSASNLNTASNIVSSGSGIFVVNSSGMVTVLKKAKLDIMVYNFSASQTLITAYIYYNNAEASMDLARAGSATSVYASASFPVEANPGDTFYFSTANGTSGKFSITAFAESDTIVTDIETFSSDSAIFTHKTSAVTSTDPIGTFSTYSYAINSNTRTVCPTAPSQSINDMNANGVLVYTRAYNAASSCGSPARIEIVVGKGLKGADLRLYKSSGKVTPLSTDYFQPSAFTNATGLRYKQYDELTGILTIDAGYSGATTTSTNFEAADLTTATSGYLVINASKNPAFGGVSQPAKVFVRAVHTAGQSMATTGTTVTWDAAGEVDTHGAFNTASGIFTAPEAGYYSITAGLLSASGATTNAQYFDMYFYKNGVLATSFRGYGTGGTIYVKVQGTDRLYMNKGDTFYVQGASGFGAARALHTDATWSNISIMKE